MSAGGAAPSPVASASGGAAAGVKPAPAPAPAPVPVPVIDNTPDDDTMWDNTEFPEPTAKVVTLYQAI